MRNLDLPGRSVVRSRNGMAATSHVVSSMTAVEILKKGGNAMDAAIAACAVQCVVEPESTGIGGDNFCLYAANGAATPVAFNGSGRAPAAATAAWYQEQGISEIARQSPHAVIIPGVIDAWDQLSRDYGTMELAELLAPAIDLARNGYAITERVSIDWHSQFDLLNNDANARKRFLPDGRALNPGDVHHQPELANTLEKIARQGRDAFYKGDVAEDMVGYLQSLGGLHTMDDFATAKGEYVVPIKTNFRGYDVYECPPNGQGVIALLMLNIMAGYDPADTAADSVARLHLEIEASRLAYQDRDAVLADPAQSAVPVEALLSAAHADRLRAQIDPTQRTPRLAPVSLPRHEDTVYISVVDKDRNCCSFINTLFSNFGSGQLAPQSGVMLTNRGQGFVVEPGHPNCIAPGKRPLHTIIPGMVSKDGRAVMPFGVMGGHYQSHGHMHFLSRLLDYGDNIQEAQDRPRLFPVPGSNDVEFESGFDAETRAGLEALGHNLIAPAKPIGGSQAIMIDWENGTLAGGSDPRKDGSAIGY
ncbi:MAG: gamma-glutamyltransferase [Rhodospirillales bacterium]|nr:gamma-glutamyltransferase [Rhodospirillales bacterium]